MNTPNILYCVKEPGILYKFELHETYVAYGIKVGRTVSYLYWNNKEKQFKSMGKCYPGVAGLFDHITLRNCRHGSRIKTIEDYIQYEREDIVFSSADFDEALKYQLTYRAMRNICAQM